jgi:predicted nuclease of predicted toxin-antitoxin system
MRIYLDDCSDSDRLAQSLSAAGHSVQTPRSAGTIGRQDREHLLYAAQQGLTLVTRNPKDFRNLHKDWQARGLAHSGILLIYQDNIKGKDTEPVEVVQAIGNLLASGIPIANEIHSLNQWR